MLKTFGRSLSATILTILSIVLLTFSQVSHSAIRWNHLTGFWEGNICAGPTAWTYVAWQPVGSVCYIYFPNGAWQQGIIINQ
jgi:hypothetical protein